jgi:hypothetical protein
MTATNTAFIFFQNFVKRLGDGEIDLSGPANRFYAQLHSSAAGLTPAADMSAMTSVTGTSSGISTSSRRFLANTHWTALSAAETSAWVWDSDALVWTASGTMTVKFAVFFMSAGAGTGYPIGYIGLTAGDTEVTAGNTVTLTPNTYWFSMSR